LIYRAAPRRRPGARLETARARAHLHGGRGESRDRPGGGGACSGGGGTTAPTTTTQHVDRTTARFKHISAPLYIGLGLGTVRGARRWRRLRGVASTQWAGEGRRSGEKDEQELGLLLFVHTLACNCQQPPFCYQQPEALAVAARKSRSLGTELRNAMGTTKAYEVPPYYVSHKHIHLASSSSLLSLVGLSPVHTLPIPRPHYPWDTQGQRPGSSPGSGIIHAPSAPHPKGCGVGGAYFASGPS